MVDPSKGDEKLEPYYRYLSNVQDYIGYTYEAFSSHFSDRECFDLFFSSITSDASKDNFLRVGSHYLFLVKKGDWHVTVEGSNEVIDYITNSYKITAIFSLIESLSDEKYQDFYSWLNKQECAYIFPIADRNNLGELNNRYKETFGAIRRCVSFFANLSEERQRDLCASVSLNGVQMDSIKKLAGFLYEMRSKFVHEGQFILAVCNKPVVGLKSENIVQVVRISMETLMNTFEEGVLRYFSEQASN